MLLLPSCSVHNRLSSRPLRKNTSIATASLHDVWHGFSIQGEHKVFPRLQTFIKRKLRGIQTFFFQK